MNVHVFLTHTPHAIAATHRVAQRSAARLAHAKVPAGVSDETAGARTFVRRSHAVEREAHVATVAGDIVTPPFLRTRRTTYDRRAAPAPTLWRRILSNAFPTPTVFGRVCAKTQKSGRDRKFRSLCGRE